MYYRFDEILQRMIYDMGTEGVDLDKAAEVAKSFSELDSVTKEYVLTRLAMINDEGKDNVCRN